MVKNVKIDDEVHRQLSIRASETSTKKSDLASALVLAGLDHLPQEVINTYVFMVTSNKNSKVPEEDTENS